jgi:hypothetical protein
VLKFSLSRWIRRTFQPLQIILINPEMIDMETLRQYTDSPDKNHGDHVIFIPVSKKAGEYTADAAVKL